MTFTKNPKKRTSAKTPTSEKKKPTAITDEAPKGTRFFHKSREEDRASIAQDALNSTSSGVIIADNEGIIKYVVNWQV